ncbi:hypothetical protein J3R83DRAFT_9858 [Lanmaoa asiatica]|nr:hypothetical protein J3R83DRAFT_9858 [Lanmaoa asiatica]
MFGLLATLALAATAIVQAQTIPPNCTRYGTVVPDATCNDVSGRYNVSTYQLAIVNVGIINPACTNLYPGEVLCLGLTGQDCTETHIVLEPDTCDSIAAEYSIPKSTLQANNPNLGPLCLDIYHGQVKSSHVIVITGGR